MQDTGGGHRASAEALAGVLKQQHGASIDISIVDVLTVHGRWPYNNAVKNYRYMASKPTLWRLAYMATAFPPTRVFFNRMMSLRMFVGFKEFVFRPPTHFSHVSHPTFPISHILILFF